MVRRLQDVQHRLRQQVRHLRRRLQARAFDHRHHHDVNPALDLPEAPVGRRTWKVDPEAEQVPTGHAGASQRVPGLSGAERLPAPPAADQQLPPSGRRRPVEPRAPPDRRRLRGSLPDGQGRVLPHPVLEAVRHQASPPTFLNNLPPLFFRIEKKTFSHQVERKKK